MKIQYDSMNVLYKWTRVIWENPTVWGSLEAFFYAQLPTSPRMQLQELSRVDDKHGIPCLNPNVSTKKKFDQVINILGRMYTPRNSEFRDIICSIACSACRFVSIYLAGITGRNMSSADTYTNGRGLLVSTPAGEDINASHTRRANYIKWNACHQRNQIIFEFLAMQNPYQSLDSWLRNSWACYCPFPALEDHRNR
jgi:hypothetical protein